MPEVGVILDSGDVLVRPVGGRWFPPPAFDQVLAERNLTYDVSSLDAALAAGMAYLDEVHSIPLTDEPAEAALWVRYNQIVLEYLGVPGGAELAEAIRARAEKVVPYEPFPWTLPVLTELHRRDIPVVVLSDAWPGLRRGYRALGLQPYLRGMVISAEEGVGKPDPSVFAKARGLLGEGVDDVVFVDDYPGHVAAAVSLGMRGFRLRPAGAPPDPRVRELADLRELFDHL